MEEGGKRTRNVALVQEGQKKTSDLGPIVPLNFSSNSTCLEQVLTASGKISMKET